MLAASLLQEGTASLEPQRRQGRARLVWQLPVFCSVSKHNCVSSGILSLGPWWELAEVLLKHTLMARTPL